MNTAIRKAPSLDEFKTVLKKHSLKATPQRLAVHEAMLALGHACADMVSEYIRENSNAKVTTASVYNILAQLALLGIYQHRMSSNNKMYFDVNNFKHIHIYDNVNHFFKDVIDEEFVQMIESKLSHKRFKGYKVEGFDMQIICRPTRKKAVVL